MQLASPAKSSMSEQETYWKTMSEEWSSSGEPQKQFCKRKGINYNRFVYWRSYFLKAQGKSRSQFKALKVAPPKPMNRLQAMMQLQLPNGVKLQLSHGVDKAMLMTVLTCLESQ